MFQETNQGIIIRIKVIPKAYCNDVVGWEGEELKVRLAAVPEKDEANIELVRFLANVLGLAKSKIEIVQGRISRHKRVCLKGISLVELEEKLKGFS